MRRAMRGFVGLGAGALSLFVVCACAASPPVSSSRPPPRAPAAATGTTLTTAPPPAKLLEAAEAAIRAGDYATAARKIEGARNAANVTEKDANRALYLETSLHAYRGDYDAAARVLIEHLKTTEAQRDMPTAFREHNWLAMIRTAQGDVAGALVEHDARTRAGERGTWSGGTGPGDDRPTLTKLKDTWHRAYVLRFHAQTLSGAAHEATLRYAEEARRDYAALATPLGGYADSIAVLDAFFAMHDGDLTAARAAAKRVDLAKDDDVEDLYLVFSALDAAGDKDGAAAVRKKIDGVGYVSFAVPIMRTWIARDTDGGRKRWTPRNPTAPRD